MIELLVALVIMGTAVIAVVGGLGTAIMMSDVHRQQAAIAAHLNTFAANVEGAVAGSPGYVECADEHAYPWINPGPPYHAEIEHPVQYWNPAMSTFTTSCTLGSDPGVQLLTLHVWSDRVDRTMDVVVRKPCRATDALCA